MKTDENYDSATKQHVHFSKVPIVVIVNAIEASNSFLKNDHFLYKLFKNIMEPRLELAFRDCGIWSKSLETVRYVKMTNELAIGHFSLSVRLKIHFITLKMG